MEKKVNKSMKQQSETLERFAKNYANAENTLNLFVLYAVQQMQHDKETHDTFMRKAIEKVPAEFQDSVIDCMKQRMEALC